MRGVPRERIAISSCAILVDWYAEHVGGALDDEAEFVIGVEFEAQKDSEA